MAALAVLKTLEETWKALAPLNVPMAVMGGLALSREIWREALGEEAPTSF